MEDSNRGGSEPAPTAAPEAQTPAGLPETVPPAPPAAVEAGPTVSSAGRIPGVFFSPVTTFGAIARRPTWLLPLILWTIVSVTVTTLLIPRIDFEKVMRARLERGGQQVPEERVQAAVAMQKRLAPVLYNAVALATPTIFSLLVAAVFWGSFKSFGWDLTFLQSLGVTTHAFLPAVLGSLIFIPVLLSKPSADPAELGDMLHSNLGFLVPRTRPALHALLQSVDLFSIWTVILLAIGFALAAKVSRKTAAAVVVVVWILFILGKVGFAAIFS